MAGLGSFYIHSVEKIPTLVFRKGRETLGWGTRPLLMAGLGSLLYSLGQKIPTLVFRNQRETPGWGTRHPA